MTRKQILILVTIIAVIFLLIFVTYYIHTKSKEKAENQALKTLFSTDPSAEFTDLQNNKISLAEYEDKIVVVNTWASWSPFTAVEFPILDEVASSYKDKDVRFLAINRKESKDQIDRYLATIPNYEHIEKIVDVNDFFYAGVAGYAMPETVIYDSKGRVIEHIRGVVKKEDLENILNKVLEENS